MPLESERRIHDIWHNTSVYLRTCTIVYTHTHTYSYTKWTSKQHRSNLQRWTVGNGEHSSTKSSSKYWFWIFSTKLFYLAVKMLTIHAPHSKWHFNLPFESDFARVALASFTICVAEPSHVPVSSVIFFASIGGVRWLRPSAARSQHARNRASTWKAASCVWFPDFVSGLRSGEDCPVLPMRRSVHWYRSDRAGVWSQISNSRQFLLQQSFPQIVG